jgi:chemotaxis protein MotB
MKYLFFLLPLLVLPSCVSISTHEKLRREWEQSRELIDNLQTKLASQEQQNEELRTSISEVRSTYDELVESLKDDIRGGNVGVENVDGKLTITMGNKVLFKSGRAELEPKGQKILLTIANSLKKITDSYIQIEGHTDNVKISGSLKRRYPTNWELSADRATSVVRFLQEKGGVDPSLLILSAFSEYRPAADNSSPVGREENRRVEISLVPKKT